MKRFARIFPIAILLILCLVSRSFAAGSSATRGTVEYYTTFSGKIDKVIIPIVFVADDTNAAMTNYTLNPTTYTNINSQSGLKGFYLTEVRVVPGATGPTNGAWDLDITDASGFLISRNEVDNQSSTTANEILLSDIHMIKNTWTISVGDNAVNSATVTVYLTFVSN